MNNLCNGIQNHFRADNIFHDWEWFKKSNEDLALKIREKNLGIKRDWFIAHILIELAIDHILVNENDLLVSELYKNLEACDDQSWELFFMKNEIGEINNFSNGLKQFISHKYIFTYVHTDSIIFALNRIYQRTVMVKLTGPQNELLAVILKNFIPEIKSKIKELQKILE